jgi:predicted ATP-grasp superfamily ATP-dependent carboligase
VNDILTFVGGSVRAAAGSAVLAGFAVRAGDRFADLDLCRMAEATRVDDYPRGLAAVVGGGQDGAWMYTGALENHPPLVERLARLRPLWGNGAAVLGRVRHPRLVGEALAGAGYRAPAVRLDAREVPRDGSWLVKPRRSAGGGRVDFWTETAAATRSRGCYYQQFVEGMPCSAVYVAARRRAVLLGVTRQLLGQAWTGAGGFRYCGSVGPLQLPDEAMASFAGIGQALAAAFELVGVFGVDAVVNAAGVWPVEVNPRYTASVEVLERAGLAPAIALHAAACSEGRLGERMETSDRRASGKAILFATSRLEISPAWVEQALTERDAERPRLADVPHAGTSVDAGMPIVTVLADAADAATVMAALRERAERVLATIEEAS